MRILITLIAIFFSTVAAAADSQAFVLAVMPIKNSVGVKLKMEMRNVSSIPKVVYRGALPWVDGVSGARLVAFSGRLEAGSAALKPIRAVGAVFTSLVEIVIEPGASLVGDIDLEERFPGINEILRKEDVFVFWTYLPFDTSLVKNDELSGAVFLKGRAE